MTKISNIHDRETDFHDAWASSTSLADVDVEAAFESATAMENQYILKRIRKLKGRKLIDVGAGLGESSAYFALQGYEVTCTDISPGMIHFAQELANKHGVMIEGKVCAGERLDIPDSCFDFLYAANVLHHVIDREQMFREFHRVLKPGGWFFSWDPLAYNPVINIYRRMADQVRTDDEEPLRFADIQLARQIFVNVKHKEFWIATLAIFLKYYLINRVHPNADRYWKRIYRETKRGLWWWQPLKAIDCLLSSCPFVRLLAWNVVISGQKPL